MLSALGLKSTLTDSTMITRLWSNNNTFNTFWFWMISTFGIEKLHGTVSTAVQKKIYCQSRSISILFLLFNYCYCRFYSNTETDLCLGKGQQGSSYQTWQTNENRWETYYRWDVSSFLQKKHKNVLSLESCLLYIVLSIALGTKTNITFIILHRGTIRESDLKFPVEYFVVHPCRNISC